MSVLLLALSLFWTFDRPVNWQALIGVVQRVSTVQYPDGRQFTRLHYSDERTVDLPYALTVYGPRAPRTFVEVPSGVWSIADAEADLEDWPVLPAAPPLEDR